jgi:adenosylcobyric acid synthase
LGLLDIETTFTGEKRTVRAEGHLTGNALGEAGTPASGYEIHMGVSLRVPGVAPLLQLTDTTGVEFTDGAVARNGQICGSYLHGIFDHPVLRRGWLNRLRADKGLPPLPMVADARADIDRLADHVAANIDMELLEKIIGV